MIKVGALLIASAVCLSAGLASAQTATCGTPAATVNAVVAQLGPVTNLLDANGGIFLPNRVWLAIVDRQGKLCSVTNTAYDPWPAGRPIAIALASTANGLSNNGLALSTANLYALTQPGGQFIGLADTNPFNPTFDPQNSGAGFVPGGTAAFGGGVALYSGGQVIGGIGVAGDSSCGSHAIAYRIRKAAGLDGIPGGVGLGGTDNIVYATSSPVPQFRHPHCFPTDITP